MKEFLIFLLAILPWSGVGQEISEPTTRPDTHSHAPQEGGGRILPCDAEKEDFMMSSGWYYGSGNSAQAAVRDGVAQMKAAFYADLAAKNVTCADECVPPGCELMVGANGNYSVIPLMAGPPTWTVQIVHNGNYKAWCTTCD